MSLTTTTLSSAMAATDYNVVVASATGVAAGYIARVDGELLQVGNSYVSGTTVPVLRARDGGITAAHVSGANITFGTAADFAVPSAQSLPVYPMAGRTRILTSYSATGAVTLPVAGADAVAVLNGTSVLAMTVAAPTKDMDGSVLTIVGNGAAAHTVTFAGGLNGAGSSYDVVTTNAGAPIRLDVMAVNAKWMIACCPAMTGTVTNIVGGVA